MESVYAKYFPSYKSRPHLTIGTEKKNTGYHHCDLPAFASHSHIFLSFPNT